MGPVVLGGRVSPRPRTWLLFALIFSLVVLAGAQANAQLEVRGIRSDDGNGVEITSAALAKLDEGPADGALAYTLYVAMAPDAPFEPVPGSTDVVFRAKAPVDAASTQGNRRTAKNKVVLVDPAPLRWTASDPWPQPRRYRVGEKTVAGDVTSADERFSATTEPRPAISRGVDPDAVRIELDEIPRDGRLEVGFSLSLEDQHYDVAGAGFTVRVGT
jgi:hypothetical protein